MQVRIEYCVVWNYEARAAGLAAEIRREHPAAQIELVPSSGGVFEVTMSGRLIFSKKALGRHAEPGEVRKLMSAWE